jgi:hypothetical protein
MTVTSEEFLRRFLLHVLPHGFVRIRFFGFLANRSRHSLLPLCRQLLAMTPMPATNPAPAEAVTTSLWRCPRCGGPMLLVEKLSALRTCLAAMETRNQLDSS